MKPAHAYLYTDHSRQWWRYVIVLPGGGMVERSGIGSPAAARLVARLTAEKSFSLPLIWQPTRSVPHPEEE